MNKFFIGIIIFVVILVGAYLVFRDNDSIGATITNLAEGNEGVVYSAVSANSASISFDIGDDTIIYEGEPTTSVSVGDVIVVKNGATAPLDVNRYFFVRTASTSKVFEVSETLGGTVMDLTASSTGGEFFYEQPIANVLNVQGFEKITVDLDVSGTTVSTSVRFVGSISNDAPNFYASQSATNAWDYIDTNDIQNVTEVEGDAGLNFTTKDHRLFEIYSKNLTWISAVTDDLETGTISIKIKGIK